ncbi:MAG: hypothetical protein ACOX0W_08005 [Sphaerochaetaceae bacterium]|jgi:hypothetical protein
MIRVFIKKAFFDGWDNLITLVLFNVAHLLVFAALYGAWELLDSSLLLATLAVVGVLVLYSLFSGVTSSLLLEVVHYRKVDFSSFSETFSTMIKHSLVYALALIVLGAMIFVISFYFLIGHLIGTIIAFMLVWVSLLTLLALSYYFPLAIFMKQDGPLKTLKKSYIIAIDNIGFSVFFGIYRLFNMIISLFFATTLPGFSGDVLSQMVALKLLLYKYDYLEENPDAHRKHIPWESLLVEEEELIGERSIKGMIFPWRD